jgi:hypothetical protein
MDDLDATLRRLRGLPTDPRLETIDSAVLATVTDRRLNGTPLPGAVFGVAATLALGAGVLATALPPSDASVPSAAPFGVPSALAPSTLLGVHQ